MELTNYQWSALEAKMKNLLDAKAINDQSWLEKVKARKLTVDEAIWLSLILAPTERR